MVTINQKLSLFSNLLQRSINEAFKLDMYDLQQEYSTRLKRSKEAVDREAADIISRARKRAEYERVEQSSRNNMEFKKEYMSVKEKCFSRFMDRVADEIDRFTRSDRYNEYVISLAGKLKSSGQLPDGLVIYMAGHDIDKHADAVKQKLLEQMKIDIEFRAAPDNIIGGFIAEDPANKVRLDLSLSALLEDNKAYIMQALFQAIETGDVNDIR